MNVKQAANVVELIEFFAKHKRPATMAEIAKHFDWPRSSTFNLLGTLASRGYLYEPRARAGYYPSPLWLVMLQQIERAEPIPEQFRNLLVSLADQTGETAVLAATCSNYAMFIDAVESRHAIRYTASPGKRVPLHVTATGRALLSQLSAADRASVLRRAAFERYTSTTLMSVAAVEKEIQRSIQRGFFEGNAEYTEDLGGVALPLRLPHRHFAVLVAGPMFRIKSRSQEFAEIMRAQVDHHLGDLVADAEKAADALGVS
ncbi:IclR family transcriptional regulator [Polaromonas sp. AET17H-212]|uniref:IclR family transcriptional regulator n=1 Tax=Polaromonas sp. AET17H-212 TaxID=1977061 RepID=UPI000BBCCE73|nr:IclR family transcriptional regulator C-terminal domain-containing protein [Polaromonas sp. AET17H-212]